MNYNLDQPTAAQIRRRATRTQTARAARTWSPPSPAPSVSRFPEPPGRPGGWIRAEWRKREQLAARLAAARKREQAEQRLALKAAAARIAKKRDKAKAATIARLLTSPPRRRPTTGRTTSTTPTTTSYVTRGYTTGFTVR